ncbi:MAG: insulinase family protein [Streptosporangiales bacterium]|nr:insulinase family protein [Streptosporangiales bacterium]MBO0891295.1 insulinase family protein [Acidothermales bacterium]
MTANVLVSEQPSGSTRTLFRAKDGTGAVRRTVLPGGLRVLTEAVPNVRSVSFGIWVGVGSRDESPALAGTSHYLEHLLFKGTRRRTALDIAAEIDAVGGEMNAFTTKEYTCFYARVLDVDLPLAVDVVCDMITSSAIASEDVDNERGVVLEEISMNDDDPGDVVHDAFAATLFGDSPLGRPILGTVESIKALTRRQVSGYYRRRYKAPHMVIAAAGNLDHAKVVRQVRSAFARADALGTEAAPTPPRTGTDSAAGSVRNVAVVNRTTEQANLVLGTPGVSRTDERRFALGILNAALGGGMSSRLFQEVREKRGLAYNVFSYASQYAGAGLFGIYAGCQPEKVDDVLAICRDELVAVADHGIGADELDRGKGQLRGAAVLGMEDMSSRMSRLGKSELVYGELLSVDQILARVDAVTREDVQQVARDLLDGRLNLAVVGPFDEDRDFSGHIDH